MSFTCIECFDTKTIDRGGVEIPCPFCPPVEMVEIKLTGLGHGLGEDGVHYDTAVSFSSSTITFRARTRAAILNDVVRVRQNAEAQARREGRTGRNSTTSGAIAIERKVRKFL